MWKIKKEIIMIIKKFLVVMILMFFSCASFAQNINISWTAYLGSQDKIADWSKTVRGIGRHKTGMSLLEAPSLITSLKESVQEVIATNNIIIPTSGFGANMSEFLNFIYSGNDSLWKATIRFQIDSLAPLTDSANQIFYQQGNEITKNSISEAIHIWADSIGIPIDGTPMTRDEAVIPFYVEYNLAPTTEAIKSASLANYGDKDAIPIVLGSIGNASNSQARSWLDSLLNYIIKGTYAPTLAGKKVYEIVNIITVHYIAGDHAYLDEIWGKWNGVGTIEGIFTTEEIGRGAGDGGIGAARAIRLFGRYATWYYQNNMTPAQGRYSIWGWGLEGENPQTSADEGFKTIKAFLSEESVIPVPETLIINSQQPNDVEGYLLQSGLGNKRIITLSALDKTTPLVEGISMGTQEFGSSVSAEMHLFNKTGHFIINLGSVIADSLITITFPEPVDLSDAASLLIFINLDNTTDINDDMGIGQPGNFRLSHNYPNPFNPSTTIRFSIPQQEKVSLKIIDVLGRIIAVLVNGILPAGEHSVLFDAHNLASGIYFYSLSSGNFINTKKLILLK